MELIKKGKKIVIGIIIALIIIDIITIPGSTYIYAINGSMNQVISHLIQATIRLGLESIILFFLYKGHIWAKNLMVILLLIGGFFGLVIITSSKLYLFEIYFLIMSVVFIISAIILTASKSVKSFLYFQKNGFNE
ncbi:hypothetical protein [Anaerovorax odorimutans]|uniref:hypothetical protein n=1 Tax=Anaerovorax odorimutans TaxID=109327 RepID=UPI0004007B6F|nr:hypothetical protein [Anaerovorax odorimutans]